MANPAADHRIVAVFDVGTTHVKLTGYLRDGTVVDSTVETNMAMTAQSYTAWDLERLESFLFDGLAALGRHGTITDVVPTTHGASTVLLAEDGPAVPMINYEWDGYGALDSEYDALRPAFAETGSPHLPGGQNVGRQIFFVERMMPDAFARVRAIVPYPQYWGFVLTGELAADASSLGAQSDLWAPFERRHSSLVRARGWQRMMAPVMRSAAVLGRLRPNVARRTGLSPSTRVRVGIHDSNASLVPHLRARAAPFTLVSSGTWAIVFAVGGDPGRLDEARDCVVQVNALGDPVPGARLMAGREFEIIAGRPVAGTGLDAAHAVMASGAAILPSFAPGVGPFGGRRGSGADDPRLADPALRHAAGALYTAMCVATSMALAGADGPLLIDGPLGRDTIVPAALAVLTGRPVEALSDAGSSVAAAALGGVDGPVATTPVRVPEAFKTALLTYHAAWRAALG